MTRTQPGPVHPTRQLQTPAGDLVDIDLGMVDLIEALWAHGYTTLMCCQDAGDAIRNGATLVAQSRWDRYANFYDGYAWLKTPVDDMVRLVGVTWAVAKGNGWAPNIHIRPEGPTNYASLHFPALQIGDVTDLLRQLPAPTSPRAHHGQSYDGSTPNIRR